MFTELRISNFRIFDHEITIRLRPITIFVGQNSSGKSSVLKLLLSLQQSTDPGSPRFLSVDGASVSLGVFSRLKNTRTRKRSLRFQLTYRNEAPRAHFLPKSLADRADNIYYRTKATIHYANEGNNGHCTYTLLNPTTNRTSLKIHDDDISDSTFLDPDLPIKQSVPSLESQSTVTLDQDDFTDMLAKHELISTQRNHLRSMRHLSAVRDESQRVFIASYPPVTRVGPTGQYTLSHLQRLIDDDSEQYKFIEPHLRRVAGITNIRFATAAGYLSQAFARNATTGADVLIADYGFGVSQCLPVLVQGTLMRPYTLLVVEQPEAHLHPTAQLDLGSFFASLWNERKVGSIVETHSNNVLLRLRRLVAKKELSPRDISVVFFTREDHNRQIPAVRNLDINEDGSMDPGLPIEFFGADVLEGLKLGSQT